MVEGTGLENRHTGNGIVSSNLTPSVMTESPRSDARALFYLDGGGGQNAIHKYKYNALLFIAVRGVVPSYALAPPLNLE